MLKSSQVVIASLAALTLLAGACLYRVEPADGKQLCAAGKKPCPDGYFCINDHCSRSSAQGSGGETPPVGGEVVPSGGTQAVGGQVATITPTSIGSTASKGGTIALGGVASGGARSSGGTVVAVGGTVSSAIATSIGTSSKVTFSQGQAQGLINGFAWVALGKLDVLTDPTCGVLLEPISMETPCVEGTNWNSATAVCISGFIPAVDSVNPDFNNNWGMQIGINTTEPPRAFGVSAQTITFNMSGLPKNGVRAILHRYGDAETVSYCAPLISGTAIPFAGFNTQCWGATPTVYLTASDVPKIDKVGIQVPSVLGSSTTVSNLCLDSIVLAP